MRPGDKTVTFGLETWQQGTRGLSGAYAYNRPYIENMRLYADGSLGPRPAWRRPTIPLTFALGDNTIIQPGVERDAWLATPKVGWLLIPGAPATFVQFSYFSGGFLLTLFAGAPTIANTTGPHSWIDRIGDYAYLINGLYVTLTTGAPFVAWVNGGGNIQATFGGANTFTPVGSAYHNARGFHWGPMLNGAGVALNENRIYFSDINAPATFTSATQFFDVEWPVAGAQSLGSVLLIWGHSGQWAALQGGRDIPTNGTLVPLGRGRIPSRVRQPAIFDNHLVFMSSDLTTMVTVDEGGQVDDVSLAHLGQQNSPANYQTGIRPPTAAASSVYNTVLVPWAGQAKAYQNQRGVWTEETWGVGGGGATNIVRFDDAQGQEQLYVQTGLGQPWTVYGRPVGYDPVSPTPLLGGGGLGPTGSESFTSNLYMPRISDPHGQVRITRVIVDGKYWGSTLYPTPDLSAYVATDLGNQTMTPGPTSLFPSAGAVGTSFRYDCRPAFEHPMAAWFEFRLEDMVSVAIERVTIEYEVSNQETW